MWGLAAVTFGSSLLSNWMSGSNQAAALSRQSSAESQAIAKHNMSQVVRNHYSVGLANMQLGLTKRQLAQQNADIGSAGIMAKSALEANVAAGGNIGASVDAAKADIKMKVDAAKQSVLDDYEMSIINYNNELEATRMNALNAVVQPRQFKMSGGGLGSMVLSSLASTAMSFGSNYALQRMNLNLGSTTRAPTQFTPSISGVAGNIPALNYLQ